MKFEKQNSGSVLENDNTQLLYRLEDKIGTLEIIQRLDQDTTIDVVRIKDEQGNIFELNNLLPNDCHFYFDYTGAYGGYARYEHDKKEVVINQNEIDIEKWQYLTTILHEIGHAVRADVKKEEVEEMLSLENRREIEKDPELFKRFCKLKSQDERDAWAFAIKTLKKMKLAQKLFSNQEELKDFIRKRLKTHKDSIIWKANQIPLDFYPQEKLIEELSQLFIKEVNDSYK